MPEPEGIAEAWWLRFGPLSLESTRRIFRRYRSGEGFAGDAELVEAIELKSGSSSMERGRLEDSVIAERNEIEMSSMLRGMAWFRLMEGGELEIGDEVGWRCRAEMAAPLGSEACWAWGVAGADDVRFSLLSCGLWFWYCLDEMPVFANCGVDVKA
jgi:hypothetical protein